MGTCVCVALQFNLLLDDAKPPDPVVLGTGYRTRLFHQKALCWRVQVWVPHHFSYMLVGIYQIARIATSKGTLRRFHDHGPGLAGLLHHGIHLCFRRDVMAKSEVCGTGLACRRARVMGNTGARPKRAVSQPIVQRRPRRHTRTQRQECLQWGGQVHHGTSAGTVRGHRRQA